MTEQRTSEDRPELAAAVSSIVGGLQKRHLQGADATARSTLARLRQCVDEQPGRNPEVWQLVLETTPPNMIGRGDAASPGESAIHLALTLYGIHQRGNTSPMHVGSGQTFGHAAGRLARGRTASTKARYDALLTAGSPQARAQHLRSLIGMLSTDGIPTDYGQLARDLYLLQVSSNRDGILRRWGRDFYRAYSFTHPEEAPAFSDDSAGA